MVECLMQMQDQGAMERFEQNLCRAERMSLEMSLWDGYALQVGRAQGKIA